MRKAVLKLFLLFLFSFMVSPLVTEAKRGCCSHHGGVAGCSEYGRQVCNDGTLSPSCTCTPIKNYIYGCTDKAAKNYNSQATYDDGSCNYEKVSLTEKEKETYSSLNNESKDDDSIWEVLCVSFLGGVFFSIFKNKKK